MDYARFVDYDMREVRTRAAETEERAGVGRRAYDETESLQLLKRWQVKHLQMNQNIVLLQVRTPASSR